VRVCPMMYALRFAIIWRSGKPCDLRAQRMRSEVPLLYSRLGVSVDLGLDRARLACCGLCLIDSIGQILPS
jgi:hypothetical protein